MRRLRRSRLVRNPSVPAQLFGRAILAEALEPRRLLASVVVNSLSDVPSGLPAGLNDLRTAVAQANAATTPTTISFDPNLFSSSKTILLSNGVLELKNTKAPITITGPAAGVTIDGKLASTVLMIDSSVTATVTGVTITRGTGSIGEFNDLYGGGIYSKGNVTLTDDTVTGNVVTTTSIFGGGGGIYNDGTMTLDNVIVSNNSALDVGSGAGIYSGDDGSLQLTDVQILNNKSTDNGGGIYCTGQLRMTDSTVANNSDESEGGGIDAYTLPVTSLVNVTIYGNSSTFGTGGIYTAGLNLANSTITDNTGETNGGMLCLSSSLIANSIIAGNSAGSYGIDVFVGFHEKLNSLGNNLIGATDGSGGWNASDKTGTGANPLDPKLGSLAFNGGLTETALPLPGSPAINAGSNALALDADGKALTTDQRGAARIVGNTVDIGAAEVQTASAATTVSGKVFDDNNANGKLDTTSSEVGLQAVTVYEDINNDGKLESGEPSAITDVNGSYSLSLAGSGVAVLRQIVHAPAYTQTLPAVGGIAVTLNNASLSDVDFGDTPANPTVVKGQVFTDTFGYGKLDSGEAGLAYVQVYDDSNNDGHYTAGELGTLTDASGNYSLALPGTGTAVLRQIVHAPAYKQTLPAASGGITITLDNATHTGQNFGQAPTAAPVNTVSGTAFNDTNKNAKLDSGESGISGITIYDDANNNSKLDNGEVFTLTNTSGNYTLGFGGTAAAVIRQALPLPTGYSQTLPSGGTGIHLNSLTGSSVLTGQNFGDYSASVPHAPPPPPQSSTFSGKVFYDPNKNAKQDSGEVGLAGWEIYDDANNNSKLDPGEATTFTTASGAYSIALTGSGSGKLRQIVPANWSQTTPSSNFGISVTLSSSSIKTGLNFGDSTAVKYLSTVATTSGLVGWWTFDSASQANSIVNGYAGTLKGGATITSTGGAPIKGESSSSGLSLNGTSAFVNTNLTTQQQFATAGTFNAWINLGSTPAASGHVYEIAAKSQFQNDLDLQVESDGSIHFYTDTGTSASFKPSSLTGWHMITAEFDTVAKTRKIFWDGKQVAGGTPGPRSASTGTFSIGASDVFTGRFLDGKVDEVSLFSDALTSSQISAIYNAAKG